MTDMNLARTRGVLQDLRAEGRLHSAAVGVRPRDGSAQTLRVAAEGGDPPSHRWRLYCASKPLLAHTALSLMRRQGVALSTDVGDVLGASALTGVLIDGLLSHTGGLVSTPAAAFDPTEYRTLVGLRRDELVDESLRGTLFYSHTLAWCVLALVVERLGGKPFADLVGEHTITPFEMDQTSYFLRAEDTRSYTELIDGDPIRLRDKRHPRYLSPNPSWGASSTIDDMLNFYVMLRGRQVAGDLPVLEMTEGRSFPGSEGRQPRSFGRGLFVDMQREGASAACSAQNFGHGASARFGRRSHLVNLVWYDVACEAAFGIFLDGATNRGDTRFPIVARALYADMEDAHASG